MIRLYLIRHCEALGNAKRLFQGTSDLDISKTGEKQLEFLKERFKDIQIDRIYTSPLIRARKTAIAVSGDRKMTVEDCPGLIELDGGIVEGKPFKETFEAYPQLAEQWDLHPQDFAPEGGETMRHAYERIWETVKQLVAENKGKCIAAATHGGVTRCLICRLLTGSIDNLKDIPWSENTAVALIEFDDELKPTLKYFNDHSHVPEEYLPKRNRLAAFMRGTNKK